MRPPHPTRLRAIDAELARLKKSNTDQIVIAGERLLSIGQVWNGMTADERREACRILFGSIRMNPREKKLWPDPSGEFAEAFEQRRRLCMHGTPGRGRTRIAHTSPNLFAPEELILEAS
jgi:hypothetical protein